MIQHARMILICSVLRCVILYLIFHRLNISYGFMNSLKILGQIHVGKGIGEDLNQFYAIQLRCGIGIVLLLPSWLFPL